MIKDKYGVCEICSYKGKVYEVDLLPLTFLSLFERIHKGYAPSVCSQCLKTVLKLTPTYIKERRQEMRKIKSELNFLKRTKPLIPQFLHEFKKEKRLNADEVIDFLENSKEDFSYDWRRGNILLYASERRKNSDCIMTISIIGRTENEMIKKVYISLYKPFKKMKVLFLGSPNEPKDLRVALKNKIYKKIQDRGYKIIVFFREVYIDSWLQRCIYNFYKIKSSNLLVNSFNTNEVLSQLAILNVENITFNDLYKVIKVIKEEK